MPQQNSERRVVAGTVVTEDLERRVIPAGEVAYRPDTGRITYVGAARGGEINTAAGDIDALDCIVMPGLVNAHTHSGMTPLRGLADDRDFASWLAAVRRFEERMTYDDIRAGLQLALAEMIASGTTAFADMFLWDEVLLGDVVDCGLRVLAAPAAFDYMTVGYPAASRANGGDALDATPSLAAAFTGEERVRVAFGPHAPYSCPPDMLEDVAARAARWQLPVHIHLSETRGEVERCQAEHGCTPVELARRRGLFDGPVLAAHGTHVTADDAAILADAGAAVAHNPVSNGKLGAGIAPVAELRSAGVRLALGTDSVASNNSLDLFEEIKTAIVMQRARHEQSDRVSAADLVGMATREGAHAIGFPDSGRLAVGAAADLIVLRADSTRAAPLHSTLHSPLSFVAFAARGSDVRDVVVAGRTLMRGAVLRTVDEAAARDAVARTVERISAELAAEDE